MADRLMQVSGVVGTAPGELSGPIVKKLLVDQGDGTHAEKVVAIGGSGASANQVQGTAADGAAAAGNPIQIGGKDGAGNAQTLATDTSGNVGVGTGTAGTSATNVATVQGIAGGTPVIVGGAVASGATDSGNPVKMGGVYNSSLPALTAGQRGDLQIASNGLLGVSGSYDGTAGSDGRSGLIGFAHRGVSNLAAAPFPLATAGHGLNGSSTYDRLRSGIITPSATLTGQANTLPWAIYNAAPTTRTEGQGGPLQALAYGALEVGLPLLSVSDLTRLVITNAAASGNTTLVAAVAAQTTRVHRLRLSVAGACVVKITDGAGGATLDTFNFSGNGGGVILDLSDRPYYKTSANTLLNLNVSTAVQVDGVLEYVTTA